MVFQAMQQDVMSYQRVIESISDNARSLIQKNKDSELEKFISQTGSRYKKLCAAAKVSDANGILAIF